MVSIVKKHGIEPVLFNLPPIDAKRYFKWFTRGIEKSENILKWLGDVEKIYRLQELYSDTIVKMSYMLGCRLIDLRSEFLRERDFDGLICIDGIHPNKKGHILMTKTLTKYISENGIL